MHLDSLLVPAFRARLSRAFAGVNLPHPADDPRAHASGGDALRILVIGAGPTKGWGVRSNALALPGQLARRVAQQTGRGVDVDLVATDELPSTADLTRTGGSEFDRYDAVVLTLGMADALQRGCPDDPGSSLERTVKSIRGSNRGIPVVIAGVTPPALLTGVTRSLHRAAVRFAARLDGAGQTLADTTDGIAFVPLLVSAIPQHGGTSAEIYARWGADLTDALVPLVRGRTPPECRPVARLRAGGGAADAELVGALLTAPSTELDRLLAVARNSFGVSTPSITLLDEETACFRRNSKEPVLVVARRDSMCTHTVEQRGALVVEDLREDPRFQRSPVLTRHGYRFYAGYPLEAEDGRRLGALCLLDEEPRPRAEIDLSLLRDIAMLAQRELAAMTRELLPDRAKRLRRA